MSAVQDRPLPIVAAPMAGASTPELVAAVSGGGGLGFLGAGYQGGTALREDLERTRALTAEPFGVNLFAVQVDRSVELAGPIERYRRQLLPTAQRYDVQPGEARHDTADLDAKLELLTEQPVAAVTFTFGGVDPGVVARLHAVGSEVGFTVTGAHEARQAVALGADFLVAQGRQAGGHRGTWNVADRPNDDDTATVVRAVADATGLPVMAAGGADGHAAVRELLAAGAFAVAAGTLFLAASESAAPVLHRDALTSGAYDTTRVTRAFSGRPARALVNDFVRAHDEAAPPAYPNLHHLTRPIRAAAAAAGDPEAMALWAGTGHARAVRRPAAEVLATLAR